MPKPQDITLRDLTVKPVKGASSPLISTVLSQRDGTRSGGGGGTPIDPPPSEDPRFAGSLNPPPYPGGAGLGTNDPAFSFDRFEYLGSFCLPKANGPQSRNIQGIVCEYNPPNGVNGPNGSLFCAFNDAWGLWLWEYEIPSTLGTGSDHLVFTDANILQGPIDLLGLSVDTPNASSNEMSSLKLIDGKLFVDTNIYYGDPSPSSLLIINNPADINGSTYQGWITYYPQGFGDDKMSGYVFDIPASKRSLFGGHTHMAGNCMSFAVIGRGSEGPSLFSFDSSTIGPSTTQIVGTPHAYWRVGETPLFFKYDDYHVAAKNYYQNLLGMDYEAWIMVPNGATTPQSSNLAFVTNELTEVLPHITKPDGSSDPLGASPNYPNSAITDKVGVLRDSIVVRNQSRSVTYTLNVDYTVTATSEGSPFWRKPSNWARGKTVIQRIDGGSISVNEVLSVDYTYQTQREDDLTHLALPDKSILNDALSQTVRIKFAFIVPNSNTIMFIGKNAIQRYGMTYKMPNLQSPPTAVSGGLAPVDARDTDDCYWLMNISDVLAAAAPNEVTIYEYGVFDNNRWWANTIQKKAFDDGDGVDRLGGTLSAGAFDLANKKIYLAHRNIQGSAANKSVDYSKHIISVYRIND